MLKFKLTEVTFGEKKVNLLVDTENPLHFFEPSDMIWIQKESLLNIGESVKRCMLVIDITGKSLEHLSKTEINDRLMVVNRDLYDIDLEIR